MKTAYIGFDPGKSGAVALISESEVWVHKYPILEGTDEIDFLKLYGTVFDKCLGYPRIIIACEKVQGDEKFGGYRAVKFGEAYGGLKVMIRFLAHDLSELVITAIHVRPQEWKKALIPQAMVKDAGDSYAKHKAKAKKIACEYVLTHYPNCDIFNVGKNGKPLKTYDDNKAEAICLAMYAQVKGA